jgi:DNA-binding transcriptional ArsR family regulator
MTSLKKPLTRYNQQATLFKSLAHPARLGIIDVLRTGEACVCHLEAALGYRQAYISQQLSVLKDAGLITDRRDGKYIYFSIRQEKLHEMIRQSTLLLGVNDPEPPPAPALCTCPKCNPESGSGCCD